MPETADTRISKIVEIAQELRNGKRFEITRLTRLKSLCEDKNAAEQFAIYMARLTKKGIETATRPNHLDSLEWEQHKELVTETISRMESYLESPTPEKASILRKLLPQLELVQGQRDGPYGVLIRIINNRYVLLTEDALRCLLYPDMTSNLGYELAKHYAERYNPSYGTGLIPESAPLVEDIANFWCGYYFDQTLEQWKNQKGELKIRNDIKPKKKRVAKRIVVETLSTFSFERFYPNITRWVNGYGWIEIGQNDYSSSFIRVLDEGGLVWEGEDSYETMNDAMKALESGIAEWMKENES
jgi:hypothetical protein